MGCSSGKAREGCICDVGEHGADPISHQRCCWLPPLVAFCVLPPLAPQKPGVFDTSILFLESSVCPGPCSLQGSPTCHSPRDQEPCSIPCPLQQLEASGDSAETNPLHSPPPPHLCPELAREAGRGEGLLLRRDVHQPAPALSSPGTWDLDPPWLLVTRVS